jgi:hypothetical protein
MIQGEIIYPGGLGLFHFYDYLPENGLQFVQPHQGDLLDLEKPVLLVPDFTNLVAQVVQSSVGEPSHQHTENSAEDGRANQDGGVALDSEILRPCGTGVLFFDSR